LKGLFGEFGRMQDNVKLLFDSQIVIHLAKNLSYHSKTKHIPIKYRSVRQVIDERGVLIQVDIGGHPPFSTGSKQFSGKFGNLLFLVVFNFWGHFEGPNEFFFEIEVLNDIQRND
jgi:hypothetical protein